MRGFGEITRLCDVARPDIGVVTTVGRSHTERVGGIEGVAVAKRELVEALPASGTAVLNADDERVKAMAAHTGAHVLTYGRTGDVRVTDLSLDELARPRFTIDTPWGSSHVRIGDERCAHGDERRRRDRGGRRARCSVGGDGRRSCRRPPSRRCACR